MWIGPIVRYEARKPWEGSVSLQCVSDSPYRLVNTMLVLDKGEANVLIPILPETDPR